MRAQPRLYHTPGLSGGLQVREPVSEGNTYSDIMNFDMAAEMSTAMTSASHVAMMMRLPIGDAQCRRAAALLRIDAQGPLGRRNAGEVRRAKRRK